MASWSRAPSAHVLFLIRFRACCRITGTKPGFRISETCQPSIQQALAPATPTSITTARNANIETNRVRVASALTQAPDKNSERIR